MTAIARNWPACDAAASGQRGAECHLHFAGHDADRGRRTAAVVHGLHLGADHRLELQRGQMRGGSDAECAVVDLARPRFDVGDQIAKGPDRQRRVHHQHAPLVGDGRDRNEVALRVGHLLEQRIVRDVRQAHHHDGVAVGGRARRLQGPERGRGAGPVDHQYVLAEAFFQALLEEPRGLVDGAAGRIGNDQMDRPVGKFRGFGGRRTGRCDRDDAAEQCNGATHASEGSPDVGSNHRAPPRSEQARSETSSVGWCCGCACGPWLSAGRTPIATAASSSGSAA